ncbi:MAG TPA: amidohydrolase family protein [Acidimicrobiales bacterium]|nr:amidohydrolase family protein [Acidimicrobiales bacterium]
MSTRQPDLLLKGGTVVDGTGRDRFVADIAISGGLVTDVRPTGGDGSGGIDADAREVIDARGLIVTPGFVDVHTHYDGQATWDEVLNPSTGHGVTTIVTGNCGVGFAPVPKGREQWLIELMEGVEDIPGTALAEGIKWDWESFPEYLDALDRRRHSIDIGSQIAHGAVRAFVMGERGARNEPATSDDIAAMGRIVQEAIEAGALGFSTSRTLGHRAIDGEPVPGTFAAEDELFGLGRAMARGGRSVFELAPMGAGGEDLIAPHKEVDWMCRLAGEIAMPVSFALLQVDAAPNLWRELMDASLAATERGAPVYPQVAGRPFGMLVGLETHHAFKKRPTYVKLASELPFIELVAQLREPAVRRAILDEHDLPIDRSVLFDSMTKAIQAQLHKVYVLGSPPNYEPTREQSVLAIAGARNVDPLELLYDLLLEHDGHALLMLPIFNYFDANLDAVREMFTHPAGVAGLGDGGAHCGMICDASIPTFLLTHWVRDRTRGEKLALEWVVKKQTADTARLYGLGDRGVLTAGMKADVNVIDLANMTLHSPRVAHDLPAGGRRLLQEASGYVATIVSGEVIRRNGVDTGARPGSVLRGAR